MNKHLNEGQLRAALDGELAAGALQHLETCAACQARQRALQKEVGQLSGQLAFLATTGDESAPPEQTSLKHFLERKVKKENSVLKKLFASPTLRFVSIAVLVLALILSFPATRALAEQMLSLFRVQQVTVVPVDFTGLQQLSNADGKQISDLISSSVTVVKEPAAPSPANDAADASQQSGFTVRLPQNMTPARITVLGDSAYNFTIDRTKAQALLDEAGRSDLVLPDNVDGAVISVTIPTAVRVDYGTCPDPSAGDSGLSGSDYPDCVILTEIPSPTVSAPDNLDIAQLAQLGLEFTGMDSSQAAAFTQSVDWTSTLVIPIPKNAATYEQVTVDGETGTLIQRPSNDAPQYVLIWIKNGIIHAISGLGSDSQQAIDMANSLQ